MEELSKLIQKRLESSAAHSPIPGRCSIHRVPERFHNMTQPSQYKPEVISIGPFHRKQQSLKAMDNLKMLYVRRLLTSTAEKNIKVEEVATSIVKKEDWIAILDACILSIMQREDEIRECYSESIDFNSSEFVDMMVIDGLFIIEMLIRAFSGIDMYNTPLCHNAWLCMKIEWDLLLLENQLPFFVLRCLFDHIALPYQLKQIEGMSLGMLVFCFLQSFLRRLPTEKNLPDTAQPLPEQCEDAKHLLDVLRILFQPSPQSDKNMLVAKLPPSSPWKIMKDYIVAKFMKAVLEKFNRGGATTYDEYEVKLIPSATDLKSAGVRFKRGSEKESCMNFKFSSGGIFEISAIRFGDGTDMMLRNVIACEQLYSGRFNMSNYVILMDSLVNSAEDVEILRKVGIIKNYLGCDEDVSNIFNKLCIDINVDGSRYDNTTQEVNKFYNQSWHTWKAMLKRNISTTHGR
ncbi:UPF0481 protein At3g47200-like [Papaver somniferum]|uniref:UPF0481 protein At3g47200-like n=1 Tax=Papaver somniferum TaxID=3469 RepID=UPI000E6FE0EC|nr:UPF0481 protein At3g47200-like [Papaver somniferum]